MTSKNSKWKFTKPKENLSETIVENFLAHLMLWFFILSFFSFSLAFINQFYFGIRSAFNALIGPLYDPVGWKDPIVSNPANSFGLDLVVACKKLTDAGGTCVHHWFGDFYRNFLVVQTSNPWDEGENPNLPLANFLTKILSAFPYNIALLLFITLGLLSIVWLLIHSTQNLNSNQKYLVIATLLLGYPTVFALDRGNTQVFIPLFLYCYFLLLFHKGQNPINQKILASLLFCWKPNTWPLLLLLFVNRMRSSFKAIFLFFVSSLFLILVWNGKFWTSIIGMLKTIYFMSASGDEYTYVWRNQGINGLINSLLYLFKLHTFTINNNLIDINFHDKHIVVPLATAVYLFISGLFSIYVLRILISKQLPLWAQVFLAASFMQMCIPRAYGYGANYVIVVLAALIFTNTQKFNYNEKKLSLNIINWSSYKLLSLLFACLLAYDFSFDSSPENLYLTAKNFVVPIATCLIIFVINARSPLKTLKSPEIDK